MPRTYDMTKRARRAGQTTERITETTERLLAERPIAEVTLQSIAAGAGVTVQTVLRHMGSREGCFEAVGQRLGQRVRRQREGSAPGDVPGAITLLTAHYEAEGRLILNLLAQERGEDPLAAQAAEVGRSYHRAWVERCFLPGVAQPPPTTIDALVAATDLYVWKLLRIDLGRSAEATHAVITRMVRALLEES